MNYKYNTFNHLDKLKCVENEEILKIEQKFENFSVDNNYDYAINILENKISMPKINIDLSKLISYYKSRNDSVDSLVKEITIFNNYFESLTKWVDLINCESLKEKSIIYYLFYFMCRCFFYIIMHNNFVVSKPNTNIFIKFFCNFVQIINTAKLYLEKDIENASMIIDEDNNDTIKKNLDKQLKKGLFEAFEELTKYPNEFNNSIICCHNFISFVLFSVDTHIEIDGEDGNNIIDYDMLNLLQIFVTSFSVIHDVNEYFSILDYKKFYNDSLSKNLNIRREFRTYLHNERVKQRANKEKLKQKSKKDEREKNNNKINIEDIKDNEEEELDDLDKNKN